MMLYGSGLRVSEALGLTRKDVPFGEWLRITGKGGKIREVPVLPAVAEAVAAYAGACPFDGGPDDASAGRGDAGAGKEVASPASPP